MTTSITANLRPLFRAFYLFLIAIAVLWATPRNARAQIYVTNTISGMSVVSEYNAATGELLNATFITGLTAANALAVQGNTLFVTNNQHSLHGVVGFVGKYDATTGGAINPGFITGLEGRPFGIAASDQALFVTTFSTFEGLVGKYNAKTGSPIKATFIWLAGPIGLALKGNTLFVATTNETVDKYDADTGAEIKVPLVTGLDGPFGIAVSGKKLFVPSTTNDTVGEYNANTGATINATFIKGLKKPIALAVLGKTLFVANSGNGTVGQYNANTGATINATFIKDLIHLNGIAVKSAK